MTITKKRVKEIIALSYFLRASMRYGPTTYPGKL